MASIILASIALALTLLVYLFGAWRFLRLPRFWVVYAQADVKTLAKERPSAAIHDVFVGVAFRGGGQPRNIINVGFMLTEQIGSSRISREASGWHKEVIHVPSELPGRFVVEPPSGFRVDFLGDELSCCLHLDCGGEMFGVPFTLKGPGDTWRYSGGDLGVPMMSHRVPRTRLERLLDWIPGR